MRYLINPHRMLAPSAQELHRCFVTIATAFVLFAFLFLKADKLFWQWLTVSVGMLCFTAWMLQPAEMRRILSNRANYGIPVTIIGGVLSAAVLYAVFFAGNLAVRSLLTFGGDQIDSVYRQGAATPRWIVALLLLFIIGPGEELYWRGYVQRKLSAVYGKRGTIAAVAAYTAVHLATANFTLIMAAFICGTFWALLYQKFNSIWINAISHAIWAVAIFILFPLGG